MLALLVTFTALHGSCWHFTRATRATRSLIPFRKNVLQTNVSRRDTIEIQVKSNSKRNTLTSLAGKPRKPGHLVERRASLPGARGATCHCSGHGNLEQIRFMATHCPSPRYVLRWPYLSQHHRSGTRTAVWPVRGLGGLCEDQ